MHLRPIFHALILSHPLQIALFVIGVAGSLCPASVVPGLTYVSGY